jgi:hypothetical protein
MPTLAVVVVDEEAVPVVVDVVAGTVVASVVVA